MDSHFPNLDLLFTFSKTRSLALVFFFPFPFSFCSFVLLDLDLVRESTPAGPWSFDVDRPTHILDVSWTAGDSDLVCTA
jgi:hypothetical protein